MSKLILVKHSAPQVVPGTPSREWVLSDVGRARCERLADAQRGEGVQLLFTSNEPKAMETAALVGSRLDLGVRPQRGLHENDRTDFPFYDAESDLAARIADFFAWPDEVRIGNESAEMAGARFAAAIEDVRVFAEGRSTAVIAHGTVITLFVARHNPIEAMDLWRRLKTPSYVALDMETLRWDGAVWAAS
jgi:broad specificity phosphatase PhoE